MDSVSAAAAPNSGQDSESRRFEPPPVRARGVKASELPERAAVTPPQPAEQIRATESRRRAENSEAPSHSEQISAREKKRLEPQKSKTYREIEIDPATRTVLFQQVSELSGEIVTQLPTEAQMRARQYAQLSLSQGRGLPAAGRLLREA